MKKFFFLLFFVSINLSLTSQTLFTYGNSSVSKSEFLKAYNKNKTATADNANTLRDYLDLYIKFKLKVKEAKSLHLDTLPSLTADYQNFRSQIEETYLNDEKEIEALTNEAFNRSQKDIHVAYSFIPLIKSLEVSDTSRVFNAASTVYKNLAEKHSNNFNDVIQNIKDDSIHASWADAGFVTVFSLPYQFENIMYSLKPGQVSKPFRTKNGYYIFKNIEERKAIGKIKVAQILFAIPLQATEDLISDIRKQADSVYKILLAGADFSETAKKLSIDKVTYMNGGIMPEFGVGKYDTTFENKVFSLQHDSDISVPFRTEFGYHIVKRLSRTPVVNDKNDAAYLYSLRQQVKQDTRASVAKESFLKGILKKLSYKKNSNVKMNDLFIMTDSFTVGKKIPASAVLNEKTMLFSFGSNAVKVDDWLQFAKNYKTSSGLYKGESYAELMEKFISQSATEKYRKDLEKYNPEFTYQLHEFEEGNMLFEIMERNVWSKASENSIGLNNFYDQNKKKYLWEASADAVLISCASEAIANEAADQLRAGKNWQLFVSENSQIQTDSARYELSQIPVVDRTNFTEGLVTAPVVNTADGTASFAKILKLYPANQQRNFEEARGLVINDYQNSIEQKWVEQLKKKYPVTINENVFKTLAKQFQMY